MRIYDLNLDSLSRKEYLEFIYTIIHYFNCLYDENIRYELSDIEHGEDNETKL